MPFTQEPVARDVVASVSGQVITGVTGGYGSLANTHIVLLKTGAAHGTGLLITANTANTVTVAGTVPALTADSDEFEIVPLPTIASVFGNGTTSAPLDLAGSGSASTADKVIINGTRYFYKTSGVNSPGWKLESSANAVGDLGSTVIPNLRGVAVLRVGAATTVKVRGVARDARAVIPIPTGTTLISWPFPQEVSLLNSGLQNSILGSGSASTADKVVINGVRYFYKTTGVASPGWKLESNANQAAPGANNIVLNPGGRAFAIIRAGAETSHAAQETFVP